MNQKSSAQLILKISNLIIIISIFLIIIGLFVRKINNQNNLESLSKNYFLITPTLTTNPTTKEKTKNQQKLDLNGPLICNYQTKEASISAFIKEKKILGRVEAKNEITNFLVDDDCLYFWQNYNGEKICGIGVYKNLLTQLSGSLNLFNNSVFKNFLPDEFKKTIGETNFDLSQLLNSCQKKEFNLDFKSPADIFFKDRTQQ